uniref:purine-nucleoside phosphorylase n=1 Tax=Ditylenchus dipsaci TaxID=166011 RepID=A0A915EP07_9BILA
MLCAPTIDGVSLDNESHCDCVQPTKNGLIKKKKVVAVAKDNNNKIDAMIAKDDIDPRNYDDIVRLAELIRVLAELTETPKIGIICGSGLGELADQISKPRILPFSEIPGFPKTTVQGHKGNLVFGHLNNAYVMCMQGRFHPYEHRMDLTLCSMPVRIMHLLGSKLYWFPMQLADQIFMPGLSGMSPLVGLNDPRFGARFVSLHDAYDKELRKIALKIAEEENFRMHEGVYVMSGGPQYESPSEVRFYKAVGGDALGMSTCHEVTVARQCQMRVLGFSLITNLCNTDVDKSVEVSHEEVLQAGKEMAKKPADL